MTPHTGNSPDTRAQVVSLLGRRLHTRLVPVPDLHADLPPAPLAAPRQPATHPDHRRTAALTAAHEAGIEVGERQGYLAGWRAGVGQALLGGVLLGALVMYAGTQLYAFIQALP